MRCSSAVGTLGSEQPDLSMASTNPAISGRWAEQRVLRLLQQQGWELASRNWHCRWGELDLVMCKPRRLLVVEVKGRSACGSDGWGVAALRFGKRRRLASSCLCWLADHPQHQLHELELVAALVSLPPMRKPVRWIRLNALAPGLLQEDRYR